MSGDDPLSEPVYTIKEVAQSLRVDRTTVRRWTKDGSLQAGIDFFLLPTTGKYHIVRFTSAQYQRLIGTLLDTRDTSRG